MAAGDTFLTGSPGRQEKAGYRGYAGPARITVGRAEQAVSVGGDDLDPDDGTRLDLSRSPKVEMAAPLSPTKIRGAHHDRRRPAHRRVGSRGGSDAHRRTREGGSAGRQQGRAAPCAGTNTRAPICWMRPARIGYCPACAFGNRLYEVWREAGMFHIPSKDWSQPELIGCGYRRARGPRRWNGSAQGRDWELSSQPLDEQLPDIRQRVRNVQAEYCREAGIYDDEPIPDRFLEAVAYQPPPRRRSSPGRKGGAG